MKKNILIGIFSMFLLGSGCAGRYLTPISKCQPLSAYKTIVITPFDGDSAQIEELKYIHLPPYIARGATEKLKDQVEFYYLFTKVVQSPDCVDQAIRIEGKIVNLDHAKRTFHVKVRGRIVDCRSNQPLYLFEFEEKDSESTRLSGQIADTLLEAIKARLTCQ
ncbi:MAG: hypothetical protein HY787_21775 [Deltaproteobacteria bacterium]|nr:hypothetical protein [Deltaproteobacteria bacterium]